MKDTHRIYNSVLNKRICHRYGLMSVDYLRKKFNIPTPEHEWLLLHQLSTMFPSNKGKSHHLPQISSRIILTSTGDKLLMCDHAFNFIKFSAANPLNPTKIFKYLSKWVDFNDPINKQWVPDYVFVYWKSSNSAGMLYSFPSIEIGAWGGTDTIKSIRRLVRKKIRTLVTCLTLGAIVGSHIQAPREVCVHIALFLMSE